MLRDFPTILLKMGDEAGHRQWGEKEVHELNLYIADHCDHQIIATRPTRSTSAESEWENTAPGRSPDPRSRLGCCAAPLDSFRQLAPTQW